MKFNKLKLLYEEETIKEPPLEASRYPPVKHHVLAKYEPTLKLEDEIKELRGMVFKYPKGQNPPSYKEAVKALRRSQFAFTRLLQRLQLNPMSGLRGENEYTRLAKLAAQKKKKAHERGDYIVIAADIDNMKYLNDETGLGHAGVNAILSNVGKLFTKAFQIENTKLFHPHGDEFRVISYIGDLDDKAARLRFVRLLQGVLYVSNTLAATGFYLEGWSDNYRIQPTISFGISTTDQSADGVLTHVKTGASSQKPLKFVVVIDRDLRYSLGLSLEEMNKYISSIQPKSDSATVILSDGVNESKTPMDSVRNKKGPIILECSWSDNPRKGELESIRRQKRAYLDFPEGVMKVGDRFIPLREKYKPSK